MKMLKLHLFECWSIIFSIHLDVFHWNLYLIIEMQFNEPKENTKSNKNDEDWKSIED